MDKRRFTRAQQNEDASAEDGLVHRKENQLVLPAVLQMVAQGGRVKVATVCAACETPPSSKDARAAVAIRLNMVIPPSGGLILLVVELLYTFQVSFREHALIPEPFLLVGLIAAIRRVLVLTAEFGQASAKSELLVQYFIIKLGVYPNH